MPQFRLVKTQCCGIVEMADISAMSDPAKIVEATATYFAGVTGGFNLGAPAFLMFSGVVGERRHKYAEYFHVDRTDDYGQQLADYITSQDLGALNASEPAKNHSGNMLRVWLWAPKWDAMKAIWQAKQPQQDATPPLLSQSITVTASTVAAPVVR